MKFIKKAMAMVLSLAMMMAMCVSAFAANITINKTEGHTYEIYQIFTGTVSGGKLVDLKWGANGTGTQGTAVDSAVLEAIGKLDAGATDAAKLEVITQYAKLDSTPVWDTTKGDSYNDVAKGYYLIKDKDNTAPDGQYTTYVLKVVKDEAIEVDPKVDTPKFEKKLKDINDSTDTEFSGWQDSADYDIGDKIPFKLEGTVASNYDGYKHYYFAFHDVEEQGLTFDSSTVKVYVDGTEISTGYEVKTAGIADGCTFEVLFNDLKEIASVKAGSKITVEYQSVLNDNAVLGSEGNVNKAKLEFSNNPNNTQVGKPENPGETPWDNVIVFTYKVVVNKVDGSNNALAGAAFKLEKKLADGTTKLVKEFSADETTTSFTFKGLDDGEYILTETATPSGYNSIAPITFKVTANHTIEWNGENRTGVLTDLNGEKVNGEITFTKNPAEGSLSTNIVNKSGMELPGTGGMGTTIFYVIGGMLMAAALVLLVTKKRMEANK